MSGVLEILGGIASVIATIEAIKTTYKAIQKLKGLPSAFEEVVARLPKVEDALEKVRRHAESHQGESATNSVQLAVQSCKPKVEKLNEIFYEIQQADEKTLGFGFRSFLVRFGKGNRVEDLMKEILRDTEAMACDRIFETATTQDIEELRRAIDVDAIRKAIDDLSAVEPSVPDAAFASETGYHQVGNQNTMKNYANHGTGSQYNFETAGSGAFIGGEHKHTHKAKGDSRKENLLYVLRCDDECPLIDVSPDTCDWILKTNEYKRWASRGTGSFSDDRAILWIRGKRGSGKSTLVQFLFDRARRAKDRERLELFAPGIPKYFVAAFFFNAKRNTPQLYRSLIQQLLQSLPQDASIFQDAAVFTNELTDDDPRVLGQFKKLFKDTVNAHATCGHIFCFIDALDEAAEDDIEKIVDFVHTIVSDDLNRHYNSFMEPFAAFCLEVRVSAILIPASDLTYTGSAIRDYATFALTITYKPQLETYLLLQHNKMSR
ncbi:hypothetical protein INS49_014865 [Diaporthe citri]|uniref:uncharacterized protein n=1 Tax=Diaporthe citri TaxID=83186 RepID=UPI001C7F4D77|nr:uncharacterized protein INS49_014865 [Diaporthe citri]KAG6356989.1 hypothetical protein INS49_014865 [Diaporthe citri]